MSLKANVTIVGGQEGYPSRKNCMDGDYEAAKEC